MEQGAGIVNKIGSALYRVTNIGFLTLANLLFSLLLTKEVFGAFYTSMAAVALIVSLFDIFNAKYMVNIFGKDPESWPQILPARLVLSCAVFAVTCLAMVLVGLEVATALLGGSFAGLVLFNSGLLTLFYCRPGQQRQILFSVGLSSAALLILAALLLRETVSLVQALGLLTGYKVTECLFLLSRIEGRGRLLAFGAGVIRGAVQRFPRLVFYFQNILSVASGRLHAFLLPLLLSAGDFGILSTGATLMAVYVFAMTYLGTDFFREASRVGLAQANWRRHIVLIGLSFAGFCAFLAVIVPFLYPELWPFLALMMLHAAMISLSSQQGYVLFLLNHDRWIMYLSIGTTLASALVFYVLARSFDLLGAFLAMIGIEALSVIAALAIIRLVPTRPAQ